MCRLLGYVAREETTVLDVVGAGEFEHFRHLSTVHGDGWGVAWAAGQGVASRTSAEAADDSPQFRAFASSHVATAALVHLRRATEGLAVCAENAHPFSDGLVAFAHNGSVLPPDAVDALIPASTPVQRRGDTDSERLFVAVAARVREGSAPRDALLEVLRLADETLTFTSLNCMLLTAEQLLVASLFRPEMVRQFAAFELAPDYYAMRYRVTDDSVIASSSGWPQDGWMPLANGELLTVDRATLSTGLAQLVAAGRSA